MRVVKSTKWSEEVRVETELLLRTMRFTDRKRFDWDVAKAVAGRARYERISQLTDGVPWWFIAVIHGMECSYDFSKHLHNGDPLTRRTVREPEGRPLSGNGPFTFEESAVDALTMPGKRFNLVRDWSLPRALWLLEGFNGYGYRYKGIYSPYVWSGTNHYTKGKFIRDHVFKADAVSAQAGCAGVLKLLEAGK